jgi:hypothetical protein
VADPIAACAQPGCVGTIMDDYCDVCGSPASAAPSVTTESAPLAASPTLVDESGLNAVGPKSGVPPERKNEELNTACMQPGCNGTIIDGYCDVCGSPASAGPLVPASASAASPAPADEPDSTAVPVSTSAPAAVNEAADWIDLRESREVEARLRSLIEPAVADVGEGDTAEVDPAAVDTKKVDRKKELAENGTDGPQDYRTRVEEAQLPDDVREAALREVGKLERTSDQSAESDDIRNWLDTMLDLPWSTKIIDSIEIQGSRDVEASLQSLIEPVVADLQEGDTREVEPLVADLEEGDTGEFEPVAADLEEDDTAKVDPAAADSENADRAPAGPHDDDTIETPAVLVGVSGRGHPRPQLPEQPVVGSVLVEAPTGERRFRSLALAATALAALLIGALLFAVDRDRGVTAQSAPTVTATAAATMSNPTSEPSDESTGIGGEESPIQLEDVPESGKPSQTIRIQGRFRDRPHTFLRVQHREGNRWLDFPLTTMTDRSGKFTAYVELGGPGRYQLRVLDSDSLVTSKNFVVVIKG